MSTKADHKAARKWAEDNTVGCIKPGPLDHNIAAAYLELRELAKAVTSAENEDDEIAALIALRTSLGEEND